ncbi:MAPEG family protein [Ferrovibrio sp.]|uniref:MAPEG family protein n=1 Tax=Ferrovibrio sp. TaxID=1917215 RepID=UPI001B51BCEA|nr:MAPEG family protein [Ferrovibrio sp.]MBP7062932.1 MAPEG family protein [Ferrovibrio sp.]
MSIELSMLAWSALLCLLLAFPYTLGFIAQRGLYSVAGNREDFPAAGGWIGRSHRAHLNMVENLVPFAALVLVAQLAGKNDAMTAAGAQLFFWARLGHAIVYTAGIPWARTIAYFGGVVGMLVILWRILA